ncbi:MAG: hypothetical protein LKJ69_04815 [Lactobacillus sp.]|nr:hypothetical protein [Lactobacillus sp.]MCI2032705.1 hypothetical protein [Lactobacillus sp.]
MKLHCYKQVDVNGDLYLVRNTVLCDFLQYFLIARTFGGPAKAYRLTDKGAKALAPLRLLVIPRETSKKTIVLYSAAGAVFAAKVATFQSSQIISNATAILSFWLIIMVYFGWLILMYRRSQTEYRCLIDQHLIERDAAPIAVKKQIKRIRVSKAMKLGADDDTRSIVDVFITNFMLDLLYFGMLITFRFVIFTSLMTLDSYINMIVCMVAFMGIRWAYTSMTKHPSEI